jgi:hypothetical protein
MMSLDLMKETKYLTFYSGPSGSGKTKLVVIMPLEHGHGTKALGRIKWFGRWRQYAFFPEPGTVWNPECMDDVTSVIKRLMEDRRLVASGVAKERS